MALKSSASSRSGWARFLRPVGTDHSVSALTDGEQLSNDPLSTSARTTQPLSPEADPFVQSESPRSVKRLQEQSGVAIQRTGQRGGRSESWGSSYVDNVADCFCSTVSNPGECFPKQADLFTNSLQPFTVIARVELKT